MFSCFFRSVFADVFSFYLSWGVGGDSFSACGPRCFCPQLAGGLRVLRLACAASCCFCLCPVLPGPACWKCARVLPCAAFFVYLLPFPASLFPLKNLFTCRSGRDGPLLSSEKKVDKDSRGASPLRTPFLRPAANLLLFRAAGRLTRPFGPQTAGWQGNA